MDKIDLTKIFKDAYTAKSEPQIITVPEISYLAIDGKGDPNSSPEFQSAVEALYAIAYTMKFMIKKGETSLAPIDFKVMPLEGQWYMEDMREFAMSGKDKWLWTLMIAVPDIITDEIFIQAQAKAVAKKQNNSISKVKLIKITDGLSVQLMHLGPYSAEASNIQKMHKFAQDLGYKLSGKHREIYFSDPRKAQPDKMKTILRQPISK